MSSILSIYNFVLANILVRVLVLTNETTAA